jgi:hypothetical protein
MPSATRCYRRPCTPAFFPASGSVCTPWAETLVARPELAGRAGATSQLAWHYAASHDHPRALVTSLHAATAAAKAVARWSEAAAVALRAGLTD